MNCPRCDGTLATFAVEATGKSAVVCESCGFAGVAASHEAEGNEVESWDRAIRRFEETGLSPDRTCQTGRTDAVSVPTDDADPEVDPERFEESVAVAAALREDEDAEAGGGSGSGSNGAEDDDSAAENER
jgi:hypothetical protein